MSVTEGVFQVGRTSQNSGEKTTRQRLLWSRWLGNELCTSYTSIIPLVPPTCCTGGFSSLHQIHTPSKQSWDAGFHQWRALSAVTQRRRQKPICQNHHSPILKNFFHLSIETIFHSWHLCWLSILSVNWIWDPAPTRFCKNERHTLNSQTQLNTQHPRMNF